MNADTKRKGQETATLDDTDSNELKLFQGKYDYSHDNLLKRMPESYNDDDDGEDDKSDNSDRRLCYYSKLITSGLGTRRPEDCNTPVEDLYQDLDYGSDIECGEEFPIEEDYPFEWRICSEDMPSKTWLRKKQRIESLYKDEVYYNSEDSLSYYSDQEEESNRYWENYINKKNNDKDSDETDSESIKEEHCTTNNDKASLFEGLEANNCITSDNKDTFSIENEPYSQNNPQDMENDTAKLQELGSGTATDGNDEVSSTEQLLTIAHSDAAIASTSQNANILIPNPESSKAAISTVHSDSTEYPRKLFSFNWSNIPLTSSPTPQRRENFTQENCGPTRAFISPYDAFTAIWDDAIIQKIVDETNKNAKHMLQKQKESGDLLENSRINYWVDTNPDEMLCYFSFLIMSSAVQIPIKDFWYDRIMCMPIITGTFTYNRYLILDKCLHFAENTDLSNLSIEEARVRKVDPIIEHLNKKFESLYIPSQNLILDESLTHLWYRPKQLPPRVIDHDEDQEEKLGVNTHEIIDVSTGYTWRFLVYAKQFPVEHFTSRIITHEELLTLLNGLEGKGYTVYVDHYNNTLPLARTLKSKGFDCVGGIRKSRNHVPAKIMKNKGEVVAVTSGDIDILSMKGRLYVALLSTYHGVNATHKNNKWYFHLLADLHKALDAADEKDHLLNKHPIEKETKIWYKKFFKRLLGVSVLNSSILYNNAPNTHRMTYDAFMFILVSQIIHRHSSVFQMLPLNILNHTLYNLGSDKELKLSRKCHVCGVNVSWYCPECNIILCKTCDAPHHCRLRQNEWRNGFENNDDDNQRNNDDDNERNNDIDEERNNDIDEERNNDFEDERNNGFDDEVFDDLDGNEEEFIPVHNFRRG